MVGRDSAGGSDTDNAPLAALSSPASAAQANPGFSSLVGSVNPTTDLITGGYNSPAMQVEVALTPRNEAGMNNLLDELYTQGSAQYHKWLADGVFNARYAPTLATQNAVASYLTASGLTVEPSGSPFLIRAEGSSSMVSFAFRTTLSTYRDPHGTSYFANSTPVWLPTSMSGVVAGRDRADQHGRRAPDAGQAYRGPFQPDEDPARHQEDVPGRVEQQLRDQLPDRAAALRRLVPVRLRRRTGLQRPDAVADQLHLRRAERRPARQGQGRQPRRVRAVRLPGSPTSTPGRTSSTARATPRRWSTSTSTAARWPRSARSATPARRRSTATPATSRSTPTSRRAWRSRPT